MLIRPAAIFAFVTLVVGEAQGQATKGVSHFDPASGDWSVEITFTPHHACAWIAGAPYEADRVLERVVMGRDGTPLRPVPQWLPFPHLIRDSAGRTRYEDGLFPHDRAPTNAPSRVEICDPVNGYLYVLDQLNHVAHRSALPHSGKRRLAGSKWRTCESHLPRPTTDARCEELGTQMIEGVLAHGTRITRTLPDAIGGQWIIRTEERWYATEIGDEVLQKISDPRTGDQTDRLTHIRLAEPDPSLLQIPPDYKIVDETGAYSFIMSHTVRPKTARQE